MAIIQMVIMRMAALVSTRYNVWKNRNKPYRMLEIGCGGNRLPQFETADIVYGHGIDYVLDAARTLPFSDNTFDLIYASHVLEHIPWYRTELVMREWVRVLKPGGSLEVYVPDGLKICAALADFEKDGKNHIEKDGWYKFNDEKDPCKWAAGRLYTYGDGLGKANHPNWHRALFTPRYLRLLFEKAGLREIRELTRSEVRGYDHGWISLGMRGTR